MKRTQFDRSRMLKKVLSHARKNKVNDDSVNLLSDFIKTFYRTAPLDSLHSWDTADLFGAAHSVWQSVKKRKVDQECCRIFNAKGEGLPWQCDHTLVAVVTDFKPFLIDSVRMALTRAGCTVYSYINAAAHVTRASTGLIQSFSGEVTNPELPLESYLLFEISYIPSENVSAIETQIYKVLDDVKFAVRDWRAMQHNMQLAIEDLSKLPDHFPAEEVDESKAFLSWLIEYFTFIGFREYKVEGDGDSKGLTLVAGSGLGVLHDDESCVKHRYYCDLPEKMREHALSHQLVLVTKTNTLSTIHRSPYTDMIVCKSFDQSGNLIGERRFIGLFTSDAYDSDPTRIPFLRKKVANILDQAISCTGEYERKRLMHILKRLPRDELFQATLHELQSMTMGILDIQERRVTRLFARKDICNRFVSCLVYVPRDNYSTDLRIRMQRVLIEGFQGQAIISTPMFSESLLASVHFVIRIDPDSDNDYDLDTLEHKLARLARSWQDELSDELLRTIGGADGYELINKYQGGFSTSFKSIYSGAHGARCIKLIDNLKTHVYYRGLFIELVKDHNENLLLRIIQSNKVVPLSDAIPLLENMGLRIIGERVFEVADISGDKAFISEFSIELSSDKASLIEDVKHAFCEALRYIWLGVVENDRFNSLVLTAGLTWWQIRVFRAYGRYLKQIGFSIAEPAIQSTFVSFPELARLVAELFAVRFDPEVTFNRKNKSARLKREIKKLLANVDSADQERVIRTYIAVIDATIRVNIYKVKDSAFIDYLSFKIDSSKVPDLPLPHPLYEIFVFSERMEGIHLRAGKVARGGIRWSDRREDFRTEVLGLMKAQQKKNSEIVPAGAKGGFVPKCIKLDMTPEEVQAEAIFCYKQFIRGLLDITDNIIADEVVKPAGVVCHDSEDDPYLVVAADRGTATFSDIANQLSEEYDFWLSDAFASGGSAGYDHKKMGITAKGAWASVEWHFKTLNRSMDEPFTVVGIGGMAGDVFGNGMLLSNQIKLIAAFNHRFIFIDPNPDPEVSYNERKRLFKLKAAAWSDYDSTLLSKGAGIYGRHDKNITISTEAMKVLGLTQNTFTPEMLIRAILSAKVDLIWNGGIGTYGKHSDEKNQQVGDHGNDEIRLNGKDFHCAIIGEGGNLGWTQLSRIEYELSGGRVNTDFIDNSAGVDCSDHEVNIKIFLNEYVKRKRLSFEDRNILLTKMTNDVAKMVLKHNVDQNLVLSIEMKSLPKDLYLFKKFMNSASEANLLDMVVEYLPNAQTLSERIIQGCSLTRPELSVLLSYSKILLQTELLKTSLVDSTDYIEFLHQSFPKQMLNEIHDKGLLAGRDIWQHPLRREIIATHLSITFVHELGVTFITEVMEESTCTIEDIASSFVIVRKVFQLDAIFTAMRQAHKRLSMDELLKIYQEIRVFQKRCVRWLLRNKHALINAEQKFDYPIFEQGVKSLLPTLPKLVKGHLLEDYDTFYKMLKGLGFKGEQLKLMSNIKLSYACLNIVLAARHNVSDVTYIGKIYFAISDRMVLYWLRHRLSHIHTESRWDIAARFRLKGQLDEIQYHLVCYLYRHFKSKKCNIADLDDEFVLWLSQHHHATEPWNKTIVALSKRKQTGFTVIYTLIQELNHFVKTLDSAI